MMPLIRVATPADAEAVAAVYAPFCSTPISFELAPSADEMRGRIERTLVRFPWLVCEAGGEVLGYAYASPHRDRVAYQWSADTTVYIHQGRHRSGVGRGLYTALLGLITAQGYVNAYAGVTLPNPASEGLHRALGFEPVGVYRRVGFKNAAWHDVLWLHRLLAEPSADPVPPLRLAELIDTPVGANALASGQSLLRG